MSDRTVVDLIEDWQTGFFIVLGTVTGGILGALALRSLSVPYGLAIGGLGGALLVFLIASYLLYGRRSRGN